MSKIRLRTNGFSRQVRVSNEEQSTGKHCDLNYLLEERLLFPIRNIHNVGLVCGERRDSGTVGITPKGLDRLDRLKSTRGVPWMKENWFALSGRGRCDHDLVSWPSGSNLRASTGGYQGALEPRKSHRSLAISSQARNGGHWGFLSPVLYCRSFQPFKLRDQFFHRFSKSFYTLNK